MNMQSQWFRQVDSAAPRFANRPALQGACKLFLRVCVFGAGLGALIAPTVVCGMVLQALHSFRVVFWIAAAVMSAGILLILLLGCRRLSQDWRRGMIEIEAVVACVAFFCAATFLAVTLSTGFFFP